MATFGLTGSGGHVSTEGKALRLAEPPGQKLCVLGGEKNGEVSSPLPSKPRATTEALEKPTGACPWGRGEQRDTGCSPAPDQVTVTSREGRSAGEQELVSAAEPPQHLGLCCVHALPRLGLSAFAEL